MSTENTITIAGHSDDVVSLYGPGLHDEIDLPDGGPVTLRFSDGTVLTMEWCPDGHRDHGWKATVQETGTGTLTIAEATDAEGSWPEYTDQVAITATWVERVGTTDRWEVA